jgi:hypothetical protein
MNNKKILSFKAESKSLPLLATAFIIMLFNIPTGLFAQTNFSGTWGFNESRSNLGDGGGPRMAATTLAVTQQGNGFSVERTQQSFDGGEMKTSEKYTLDGKESTNAGMMNSSRKSTINWSADKKSLTFAHTISFDRDGEKMEFKSSEVWKMADNNKTLTIESVFSSPNGDRKTTLVYDKK